MKLHGLIVPVITPSENGEIDLDSLKKMIDFLVSGGASALFILGTTGEFQKLTMGQKKVVISKSMKVVRSRVPMLVGVSASTTAEAIEIATFAELQGANGLVIAPMCFEEPRNALDSLLENSTLPIVLYNNPQIHRNGQGNLPLKMIQKAAENSRIIGIKDSSGALGYFKRLLGYSSERFAVLQGADELMLVSLMAGAAGIVSGTANVDPETFRKLFRDRRSRLDSMRRVIALKREIVTTSPSYIEGIKQRLTREGRIKSPALFK